MQKKGRLQRIIFNNPENGYTVAVFDTDDGSFRIAGSFAEPRLGATYVLEGKFIVHSRYGEQFSFMSYEEIMPEGEDAIREFLAGGNIRGIGPKNAGLIVDTFGEDSLRIIEEEPEKLLSISGIGRKTLRKITESFLESKELANSSVELREMGIEMSDAVRIYKIYGTEAPSVVKENPYILVEDIRGITFPKADQIAGKLGIAPDSSFRIESGIRHILKTWALSGSTLMPAEMLIDKTAELLDTMRENVSDSLKDMIFNGELEEDTIDGVSVIYLYGYYHAEQRVAHDLMRIRDSERMAVPADIDNLINDAEADMAADFGGCINLSDEQRQAVRSCLEGNVTVITGGPGTGKTTIINTLVRIFKRLDMETALAAPTGRAAKRMEEASGEPAMTIHRLLEYVYSEDEEVLNFGRDEENPLEQQVIIVDEASMIDIMLMDGLLRAVKDGTIMVFTGDADQLPSVGAGNVLRDIIASECIRTVRLKEIFRQAQDSKIVINSHLINNGELPEQGSRDSDFFILSRMDENSIADTVTELVSGRLAKTYDFIKSPSDIQILTPTKRGMLGAPNLNSVLQEVVNPPSEDKAELKIGSRTFREGDKVMQLKNDYSAEWHDETTWAEGEGIFNGDMGMIEAIDVQGKTMTVKSDNRLITYSGEMFEEVDLAYAITVHKSQGSEFPVVIMPMWMFPPMLMTRNLLYTAVTRGKQLVLLIGSPRYIQYMVNNNRADGRFTGLRHHLTKLDTDPFSIL